MGELLRWKASTDRGSDSGSAVVDANMGALRVRAQLPEGILSDAEAVLPWTMGEDERMFLNGYQTWTQCPELGKWDWQRGVDQIPRALRKKYAFDRYGDYHFVDYGRKKGQNHGFSYCYFRRGETYRLIASLDENPGYTIFRYDSGEGALTITRDCAGVRHQGGGFPAFDLYFAEGTEQEVFDGWFAAMGLRPRTAAKLAGYSSWYNRYENIDEAAIQADLKGCETLLQSGDLFQIDDGWEPAVGDWLEPDAKKFPNGMKVLADEAHEAGFQAGLWLAPFVCEKKSRIYREHPDWLFRVDGKPWRCGGNWSGFYALDIDCPAVLAYLKAVFDRVLGEWGFDLVKLDFLYGAAPFGTERESRAARMRRGMELLRSWCGDKLILGCGVPVVPAFGLVDYCRVGCDVSLQWDDVWYMRGFHRERNSTRQSLGNSIFRRQLDGRAYGSDPDVFFLREQNCKLTEQQKNMLAMVNALFGSVFLTSDDPGGYTENMRRQYQALRELFQAGKVLKANADNGLSITYELHGQVHTLNCNEIM